VNVVVFEPAVFGRAPAVDDRLFRLRRRVEGYRVEPTGPPFGPIPHERPSGVLKYTEQKSVGVVKRPCATG